MEYSTTTPTEECSTRCIAFLLSNTADWYSHLVQWLFAQPQTGITMNCLLHGYLQRARNQQAALRSSITGSGNVRHCELLSQKLYFNCRDSTGPYRNLTSSIRRIRNVLGEIDEALQTTNTLGSDTKLFPHLSHCQTALEKLEVALVSYRCSTQPNVDPGCITTLKSKLERAVIELTGAYEIMTGGGDVPTAACGCMLTRNGSQSSSSAWSLVNNDSSSNSSSHERPNSLVDVRPYDGKEVCRSDNHNLQPSASDTGLRSYPSWRSMFVEQDPLSVPLNDASRLILGVEKDAVSGAEPDMVRGDGPDSKRKKSEALIQRLVERTAQRQDSVIFESAVPDGDGTTAAVSSAGLSSPNGNAPIEEVEEDDGETAYTTKPPTLGLSPESSAISTRPQQDSYKPEIKYVDQMLQVSRPCVPLPDDPEEDLYSSTPTREPEIGGQEQFLSPQPLHIAKKIQIRGVSVDAGETRNREPNVIENDEVARPEPAEDAEPLGGGHTLLKSNSCSALLQAEGGAETNESPTALEKPQKVPPQAPPPRYSRRSSVPAIHVPHRQSSRPRNISAGGLPPVSEKSPAVLSTLNVCQWAPRKSVHEVLRERMGDAIARSGHENRIESPDFVGHKLTVALLWTFYGPGGIDEVTPTSLLDAERILLILYYWNNCQWTQAERYLIGHLDSLTARSQDAAVRRVQHLLAVCASLQGHWHEAISRFMKVLRPSIRDVSTLDDGDCAAAYWLGDLYAMQNRRADALLAYAIAEHSSIFENAELPAQQAIAAEQAAVQLGVSKSDFKRRWSQDAFDPPEEIQTPSSSSLLDINIVSVETAKRCLDNHPRNQKKEPDSTAHHPPFQLKQDRTRASYFGLIDRPGIHSALYEHISMKIGSDSFSPSEPWPMPYDPLFCMANVQRGRLLAYECDMLYVFRTNPGEARLPRPLSLSKIDCFTSTDLEWLIVTVRGCLERFETEFSEVVNMQGTWFCCRYSFMQHRIATTHYFSIGLFKHPFRPGYGVDICCDEDEGMCSARLVRTDLEYDKGVHASEPKRIKKIIREYLNGAARMRNKEATPGEQTLTMPLLFEGKMTQ